jgi:hypothetical protein
MCEGSQPHVLGAKFLGRAESHSERINQMAICSIRYGLKGMKGFNATSALSQRSDRLGFCNKKFPNFLY